MLTDNGAIFTAESRRGACAIELELIALGVDYKHSRPYHPQTCGKVERFHQTLKKWLAKQRRRGHRRRAASASSTASATYYNTVRPHRALGRRTPAQAFAARTKATPRRPGIIVPAEHRVRRDRIDSGGNVTLRYQSKLLHLGVGRRYRGTRVMLLVADRRRARHQRRRRTPRPVHHQPDQALPNPETTRTTCVALSGMSRDTRPGCLATQQRGGRNLNPKPSGYEPIPRMMTCPPSSAYIRVRAGHT